MTMHFDWSKYCSSSGTVLAEEDSFPHYSRSLTSPLRPGTLVELQAEGETLFQLAVVRLVCDPLLQVSLLQLTSEGPLTRDRLWVNTETCGVFKYGHCGETGGQLDPRCLGEGETERLYREPPSQLYQPLERSFPARSGLTPLTNIRPGHKLELQEERSPQEFWRVTVTENISGILGLSLDSPDLVASPHLNLHIFSERLHPTGTVQGTPGASFSVPASLRDLQHSEQVWADLKQSFLQPGDGRSEQRSAYQPLSRHKFDERMLLAVIDPQSEECFRVAQVDGVLDEFHFEISLLEQPAVKILCNSQSQNLVPISWAIEKKFLAKASLQNMSCSPLSKIAPKHLFNIMNRTVPTVEVGQKFEYCSSFRDKTFYICHILEIRGHILIIEVWTENGKLSKLTTINNLHFYPAGFAEANNFKFFIPEDLQMFTRDSEDESQNIDDANDDVKADDDTVKTENPSDDEKPSLFVRPKGKTDTRDTSWCPPIYFNHLCYSASFLSKHRLESLPQFIGSGPVRLVMREVLTRLIGASFKSGAVLKKLEVTEDRRQDYWLQPMKGKSRVLALQADIEIPSKTSQVAGFCREVCQKLSCCPYLFGPQRVGEECPSACNSRPKSDFQAEGDQSVRVVRRGRRGRKRQKVVVSSEVQGEAGGESSNPESGTSSPSCSNTVTTNTTRDNSPDTAEAGSKRKNKNWGDILPPSEIKTRGAKLPSFSMQLKKRPSKRDVEELERLIASKCDSSEPDSPPRPPSPRLLRSKTTSSLSDLMRTDKHCQLDYPNTPAFSFHDIPDSDQAVEPPPVWRVCLQSSPLSWSPQDVASYLQSKEDVTHLAHLFVNEEVDGEAFLLLNLPTLLEHWSLKMTEAISLCRHIESVKLAFYNQFAFDDKAWMEACMTASGRGG